MTPLAPLALALLVHEQDARPLPAHPSEIPLPALPVYRPPEPKIVDLANGARVVLLEDDELPLVAGVLRVRAGSVHDPAGAEGLAALCAEVLRHGGSRSSRAPDAWLDAHAATLEARVDPDWLELSFSCLSEDLEEMLLHALALVVDPALPDDVIEKARARALGELARLVGGDPLQLAETVARQVAWGPDSPWARRPSAASLAAIGREDLVRFCERYLVPARATLALAGDADLEELRALLEARWPARPTDVETPEAPGFIQPSRTRIVLVDRPHLAWAEIVVTAPGTRRMDPDFAPLALWSEAVGSRGSTGRVNRRLVRESGLARAADARFEPGWERSGRFEARCTARARDAGRALDALLEVLRSSAEKLPEDELRAAKTRLVEREVFAFAHVESMLRRSLELASHDYPEDFWGEHSDRLRRVTAEEVVRALERHLDLTRLVVVAVGPADDLAVALEGRAEIERLESAARAAALPELAVRMWDALGGRERWAALAGIQADIEIVLPSSRMATRQWLDLQGPRMRVEYELAGSPLRLVLDGEALWQRGPQGVAELPEARRLAQVESKRRGIWALLHDLAREDGPVPRALSGDELVADTAHGFEVRIRLDEAARPRSLRITEPSGETLERVYADWRESEGLHYPGLIREPASGTEWRITRFVSLASFDPTLLAR